MNDPSQLLMVFATTEADMMRIENDPPQLAVDTDDVEFRKQLAESAKKGAYAYDAYRDLRQVSFLQYKAPQSPQFTHFMFCDDPDVDADSIAGSGAHVFDMEDQLTGAIGNFLSNHYSSCQGTTLQWSWLAGWKVGTDIWPLILNKMLRYNAWIPEALRTDITRRWSTVNYLLEVSNIYTQGVSMAMRKLPSCADCLRYWGYDTHASPDQIRNLVCTDPERAVGLIEPYLVDMFDMILKYQGIGEPWRT
jgi:hypothetical protein